MIPAGKLRHRVAVQRKVLVPDGSGGHTEDWRPIGQAWAQVLPVSGRERTEAMRSELALTHRVRVRPGVPDSVRFVHRGRTLVPVAPRIDIEEGGALLEFLCEELAPPAPTQP